MAYFITEMLKAALQILAEGGLYVILILAIIYLIKNYHKFRKPKKRQDLPK